MKNSRENIETLVAKVDQLRNDLAATQRELMLTQEQNANLLAQFNRAQVDRLERDIIIAKQRATIGKLRKRLAEE